MELTVCHTVVRPTLLHGPDSWDMNQEVNERLEACETRVLRQISWYGNVQRVTMDRLLYHWRGGATYEALS